MPEPVVKSALVAEYYQKNPQLSPKELADLITKETKVPVTNDYVSKVKGKLKKSGGKKKPAAATAKPKPKAKSKSKPKAQPKPAQAVAKTATPSRQVSQHIANIKAAVHALGKDEARRILELF